MVAEDMIRKAVIRFARRTLGLRGTITVVRVTGDIGLGGIWQCYSLPQRVGGGLTSVGPNIHATSDGVCEAR